MSDLPLAPEGWQPPHFASTKDVHAEAFLLYGTGDIQQDPLSGVRYVKFGSKVLAFVSSLPDYNQNIAHWRISDTREGQVDSDDFYHIHNTNRGLHPSERRDPFIVTLIDFNRQRALTDAGVTEADVWAERVAAMPFTRVEGELNEARVAKFLSHRRRIVAMGVIARYGAEHDDGIDTPSVLEAVKNRGVARVMMSDVSGDISTAYKIGIIERRQKPENARRYNYRIIPELQDLVLEQYEPKQQRD